MKLKNFINELNKILASTDKPNNVEVTMADCIPVVKPIFKDGVVYITDEK